MKNCKIKRVLVPYAYVGDFNEVDYNILRKTVSKQDFYVCLHATFYVFISENKLIKSTKFIPINGAEYIRFTPQQFLKHYLK